MTSKARRKPKRTWLMPQELEVWYVLPALRREIAMLMIEKGRPQKNIAKMLGVTEAAVSQYKLPRSKRSRGDQITIPKDLHHELEKSVDIMLEAWDKLEDKENIYEDMTHEINRLIKVLRDAGVMCEIHREHCVHVADDCQACKDGAR
ncbi:MAG: hypothetical protein GF411_18755 [Candidatus Lokiarchaeota archaeon]|nr:hypothetical protein [Candidatus Lokiarchaeota archaeon]